MSDINTKCWLPNTWGIHSINELSFPEFKQNSEPRLAKTSKTVAKIALTILDIAGYIPGISIISGTIRIISAATFWMVSRKMNNPHHKNEADSTAIGHLIRGLTELIPGGGLFNLIMDISHTKYNWDVSKAYDPNNSAVKPADVTHPRFQGKIVIWPEDYSV